MKNISKAKITIIGAGISGLSLAWKLSKSKFDVTILERDDVVGGLAKTVRKNGLCLDIGPHWFYSYDDEIKKTVLDLFDYDMLSEARSLKLLIKGKYIDFPITAKGVFTKIGLLFGLKAFLSFIWQRFTSLFREDENEKYRTFEDWAIKNYGKFIYKSFFGPYTEKVWNIPCDELSPDIIPPHTRKNHINKFRQSLKIKLNNDEMMNVKRDVTGTYYPRSGFGEIAEKLANIIVENGVKIKTNCSVNSIKLNENNTFEVNYGNGTLRSDYLISTITPKTFINMINPAPPIEIINSANELKTLGLLVFGMVTKKQKILSDSGIYLTECFFNRLTETNEFHLETSPKGLNILVAEIPCVVGGKIWNMDPEAIFDKCIQDLTNRNILNRDEVVDIMLNKASDAYSVLNKDYVNSKKIVMKYIEDQKNMYALGRTGEFVYRDTDMCMRSAFDLADKLISKVEQ